MMISIVALSLAVLAPAPASYVTGLSVVPVADRTEVVIELDATVIASDYALNEPARLVLDLSGVTGVKAAQHAIGRGGVRSLRMSQFDETIARIVIDLDRSVEYDVKRTDTALRISFPNRD